jgi:isopenicillin N synthase-like dioxygenase
MISRVNDSRNEELVPVVDFAPFREEKSLEKAKELFAAFRDSGFVYLQNHGVPEEIVEEAFSWVRDVSIRTSL